MTHSYEEIRSVVRDLLSGREKTTIQMQQYEELCIAVGYVFARRENRNIQTSWSQPNLDRKDLEILLEVFWDLFRQGIITLGLDNNNREFPFFRITSLGMKIASSESPYFFHDVSSYETAIKSEVPNIDAITLLYLKEAMQAFRSGCMLSSTVMLGVASEHVFLQLLDIINSSVSHRQVYINVFNEKTILQKINKFKNILDQHNRDLPSDIKEDLDTHFAAVLSVIRTFRNQSGHPTGRIIDREQVFVLLQLFIPYCKKLYQLMSYFR